MKYSNWLDGKSLLEGGKVCGRAKREEDSVKDEKGREQLIHTQREINIIGNEKARERDQ